MPDQTSPSPAELWHQAGGGTTAYDKKRYRELLIQHGHIVPLAPGKQAEPLPCGWPGPVTNVPDYDETEEEV